MNFSFTANGTGSARTAHIGLLGQTISITQASFSTTTVQSSQNPSAYGAPVAFTVVVTGSGSPTGTVALFDGAVPIGSSVLSAGAATVVTSILEPGTRSITAVYSGDINNTGSTSAVLSQAVTTAPSSVALTASVSPSTLGQSVTFSATVTGSYAGTPVGTVTFKDGVTLLAQTTLVNGTGSFTTASLSSGTHSITAVYSGDANFLPGTSSAISQVVQQLTPSISLTSGPNPSVSGQLVTVTTTVSGSAATPSGTVTLTSGGVMLGTATLAAGTGAVTFPMSANRSVQTIAAQYSGDAVYAAGASALAQTVNAGVASIALTASSNPGLAGGAVTFTATVTAVAPSQGPPTGVVSFVDLSTAVAFPSRAGRGLTQWRRG